MEDNIETFISFSSEAVVRASEKNGKKYIVGIASSDTKDDYNTIFSNACQIGFVEDCQNFNILVELEHQEKFGHPFIKNIGKVVSAAAIKENGKSLFQVETELNTKSFLANYVFDTVKDPDPSFGEPVKFGFSIYGVVQKSHFEYINGEYTKIYDRVSLRRIAMTDHPSNPDTFVEAVSRASEQDNVAELPKVEPTQEQVTEEVSRDSITIQTDCGSASGLINQLANNQNAPCNMEVPESVPVPQVTSQELKAKLDVILNEMVNQVKALQASGLTPMNMLCLMSELVEKYCESVEDLDNAVRWGSLSVNDNPTVERSSEEPKENKLNILLETLSEIKDIENAKQNHQQRICSVCSTECKADGQQCESVSRSNSEQIEQNQSIDKEVITMENTEVVEPTTEKVQSEIEPAKEVEMVSRASIMEDMKSLMAEFTTSITSSLEIKLNSVTAELDKVKQMPLSIAGNQLAHTVSRSSNSIATIREKKLKGEYVSPQENEMLQRDINRFLMGK